MDPREIKIEDYTYPLPEDRIAHYPTAQRDASRLLIYRDGEITVDDFIDIPDLLPHGSLTVLNETRVVEARLLFQKESGARIEIFCLEPAGSVRELSKAMNSSGEVLWRCLIGGASKWKSGQVLTKQIEFGEEAGVLSATYIRKENDAFVIRLSWTPPHYSFSELLHAAGDMPLPPYIKRKAGTEDSDRYQTVYATLPGSVAAPTAGLHFTASVMQRLKENNVDFLPVTLHVGAGTFKPVKSTTIADHEMHAEFIDVSINTIERLTYNTNRKVVSVGTTSMRTIESLYWIGVKISLNPSVDIEEAGLEQWFPYESLPLLPRSAALQALLDYMKERRLDRLVTRTSIIIVPGYQFKVADVLVTNFHQPQSTLLLLIAAFIGEDWRKVYNHALKNDFRFLSYGDACLFFRNQPGNAEGEAQL